MAKRTKRKNNKLSKRKYSRRRFSRHRVNKKKLSRRRVTKKEKLSRRRIYQKNNRQSGGSDWETNLLSGLEQRNRASSVVASQHPQTEVGPIKLFIFSDRKGNPGHLYEPPQQALLRGVYNNYIRTKIVETGDFERIEDGKPTQYRVIINKNNEYDGKLYIPIFAWNGNFKYSTGEWCKVTHEIGTQMQVKDVTKTRNVFVGDKNQLYPGDLCVVDEYPIIKNKIGGFNSKTNLVFAATSKDSEPTHVYFISDELKGGEQHILGADGKLLILRNPPKSSDEYKGRTKETRNVDGSTPFDPSLSGWRVKHWKPTTGNDKCPYDGGITEKLTYTGLVDYETPKGIILLFSPTWPVGKVGTKISETISFDGTSKVEPIKIILSDQTQEVEFNNLFKQLSIVTTTFKEIQRFSYPGKADIVVSRGSVVEFGAGKDWERQTIAIVNAANNGGLGGGGVDGAITEAGGPHLDADRRELPVLGKRNGREIRIQTGDAVLTGPGNYGDLHAANVIHAVGPDYGSISIPEGNTLLQRAYEKSMRVAKENRIKYIGFSLLSSGIFRGKPEKISLHEVLQIGIDTVINNIYTELLEVHFVAFNQDEQDTLISLLQGNTSIIRIDNSGEIIKQIINQSYSFDRPIYTNNKGLIIIKGLYSQGAGFILSAQLEHFGGEGVISIQVASNALLPGGKYQVATRDGTLDEEQINEIPKSHTTQEESVMDSLLHATLIKGKPKEELPQVFEGMIGKTADLTSPVGKRIKHRIYPPETEAAIQGANGGESGPATKGRPWGCSNPDEDIDDTMSIQGVDFTEAIPEGEDKLMEYASKYNFAYTLDDADMALSANYYLNDGVDNTIGSTFQTDVVFCYGPNVYAESDKSNASGTMTRSKIKGYIEDEHHQKYFRECVKMSYKATLISMKENGVKYPILCYVSGGIYSGQREGTPTNIFIRKQIPKIIEEINNELGNPFNNIFLCG